MVKALEFIHKTKVEEPPMALLPFHGRLVAGIGKNLRIYELGLKQLLRTTQADVAPQLIVSLQTQGSRIIVRDIQHGVTMVEYCTSTSLISSSPSSTTRLRGGQHPRSWLITNPLLVVTSTAKCLNRSLSRENQSITQNAVPLEQGKVTTGASGDKRTSHCELILMRGAGGRRSHQRSAPPPCGVKGPIWEDIY